MVIGVDRGGNRTPLLDAGADLVVDDLGETLGDETATLRIDLVRPQR
jgi:hypothetical protein